MKLESLTPDFDETQHRAYVSHLVASLEMDRVRNIALTGRYGAGKSSILEQFHEEIGDRGLFLSLSTLGSPAAAESRTSQIQKELVKQLLHHSSPVTLPNSRFRRIRKRNLPRTLALSGLQVYILGLVLRLIDRLPTASGPVAADSWFPRLAAWTVVWLGITLTLVWVKIAVHDRLVSSISAAGTTISLAEGSEGSYFDKYLDEIIYFFEENDSIDVVIFEDLDRFDDPGIFEDLRELNTLLNNSRQLGARKIRFVYALRDSIFEGTGHDSLPTEGPAAAEAVRANRTKFFELVIPIVPFITHRTSRDLLSQLLKDSGAKPVRGELVDLTAKHLPDMRLLKNIRNEYAIFCQRLVTEKKGIQGLAAESLFAMVVYKNVHLEDFEKVLIGQSKLDEVYRQSRELINSSLNAKRSRVRAITDQKAFRMALREKVTELADALAWRVDLFRGLHGGRSVTSYWVDNTAYDSDGPDDPAFWRHLFDSDSGLSVVLKAQGYQDVVGRFETDELARVFRGIVRIEEWEGTKLVELTREKARLEAEVAALKIADFKELMNDSTLKVAVAGMDEPVTFTTFVEQSLGQGLAPDLLSEGYIDRNFALYTSQYYGERVSTNAMNFVLQHANNDVPDVNYALTDADVDGVMRETKRAFLGESSSFNTALLDWLIAREGIGPLPGAATILDALARNSDGDVEREFLETYLSEGAHASDVVTYLAPKLTTTFDLLAENLDLSMEQRLSLIDIALRSAAAETLYEIGEVTRDFLTENQELFSVLIGEATSDEIERAVALLSRVGVEINKLSELEHTARDVVIEREAFVLSSDNLEDVTGSSSAALDAIAAADLRVYRRCIEELPHYVGVLQSRDGEAGQTRGQSIDEPDNLAKIVGDIGDVDIDIVAAEAIIERSPASSRIDDLSAAPKLLRDAIVAHRRVEATLANVATYIEHVGEINSALAGLLSSAGRVAAPASDDESVALKNSVARSLLASSSVLDAETRIQLVDSLGMAEFVDISDVPVETGPLLGLLISNAICADTEATFSHFDVHDWPTLRDGIVASTTFEEFVSPDLLDRDCFARALGDDDISVSLKHALLSRLSEFVPDDHGPTLLAALQTASAIGHPFPAQDLVRIGTYVQGPAVVVSALHKIGDPLSDEEIIDVLETQGGDYSRLRETGAQLTFPRDEAHEIVLGRLKSSKRVATRAYQQTRLQSARIEAVVK